jgi:hypothetical protein
MTREEECKAKVHKRLRLEDAGFKPEDPCSCGHPASEHLQNLPAPCRHGLSDELMNPPEITNEVLARIMSERCPCIGFKPRRVEVSLGRQSPSGKP